MTVRSTRTARPPAGSAGGSLGGSYPDPSIGCPPVSGHSLWDDFRRPPDDPAVGPWGDLRWLLFGIGGVGYSVSVVTPTADTEEGIQRLDTGVGMAVDEGVMSGWSMAGGYPIRRTPRVGGTWTCKLRCEDVDQIRVFSGLISSHAAWWAGAAHAIGFRAANGAGASPWQGFCREGMIGETSISMGIPANNNWATMRFRHELTSTGSVIVFERAQGSAQEANHGAYLQWIEAGRITTNLPTTSLSYVPLAVVTRMAGVPVRADIDFCGLGGSVRRVR